MKTTLIALAVLLASACATSTQGPLTTTAQVNRSLRAERIEARILLVAVSIGCLGFCDETRYYLQYVIDSSKEQKPAVKIEQKQKSRP